MPKISVFIFLQVDAKICKIFDADTYTECVENSNFRWKSFKKYFVSLQKDSCRVKAWLFLLFIGFLLFSCKKDQEDTENPIIYINGSGVFPQNCDTLVLGETFTVKIQFSDNVELDEFSIEIHPNFDNHTHNIMVEGCDTDTIQTPVYPFFYQNTFQIPDGHVNFTSSSIIWIPEADCCDIPYDEGAYHFMVTLKDKAGLMDSTGVNITLLAP